MQTLHAPTGAQSLAHNNYFLGAVTQHVRVPHSIFGPTSKCRQTTSETGLRGRSLSVDADMQQ